MPLSFLIAAGFNFGLAVATVFGQVTDPSVGEGAAVWVFAGASAVNAGAFVIVARGFLTGTIAHVSAEETHTALKDSTEALGHYRTLVTRLFEER